MADIIKFPSSVKKIGDVIGDDFLLDLLYKAAMNPDSEITMEDYEKYKKTGSFAEGGLASLPGYAPGGPVGFTGEKSWPSIRADTKAFDQILETANFKDKNAFHRALKRAGIDNADLAGKKNFINQRIRNIWKKKGLLLKNAPTYENIMTHGGKFNLEQAMGITPGAPGAPGNAKIWEEGKKLENQALKKFKNKGDRIKHIVDGMYKKFGRFEGVTKTLIKSAITRYPGFLMKILGPVSGLGYATDILGLTDVMGFKKDKIESGEKIEPETERFKGGGMADIYDMTRPLGYRNGGETKTATASGMHPLVEWKEIYDAWIIDGGEPMPMREFIDMMLGETKKANQGGMIGYADGGFENRMSMLRESMIDTENQRMREPDITSVAMTIAQQEGDTSEENINLIIRQLEALMPSLTKTMEKELTPMSTQGLKYLFDKMNVATGRKSDPRLNRSVGFGRVE